MGTVSCPFKAIIDKFTLHNCLLLKKLIKTPSETKQLSSFFWNDMKLHVWLPSNLRFLIPLFVTQHQLAIIDNNEVSSHKYICIFCETLAFSWISQLSYYRVIAFCRRPKKSSRKFLWKSTRTQKSDCSKTVCRRSELTFE